MNIKGLPSINECTMRKVLIESNSPNCNIKAVAEEDNRTVYFYLFGQSQYQEEFISSCWVRNYDKAPKDFDIDGIMDGNSPLLSLDYCLHPEGAEKLDPSKLEIVWFEEGDGAALLYNDEILCIIPGWSSIECPGYSRDCKKENQLAWPLGKSEENSLFTKVRKSKLFWESWNEYSWSRIQKAYLDAIEKSIGKYDKYYAIDGGQWPPKAMVTIPKDNITYIITLGVSIIPQPKVDMYYEAPNIYSRFEFGFAIETELLDRNRESILGYISAQTSVPWSCLTWLGHGHTMPCSQLIQYYKEFPCMLLINSNKTNSLPTIDFPGFEEDPINLLWIIPITDKVRKYAIEEGIDLLIEKSSKKAEDLWVFRGYNKFNIE